MKEDKNIIEVFKKRKYNEFLIELREKKAKAKEEDPLAKATEDYIEKTKEILISNGSSEKEAETITQSIALSVIYTDETLKKVEQFEKEYKDKMDERDRLIEEVQARLQIVETYEQEMEIYKQYGIIDESGKIYDYKK